MNIAQSFRDWRHERYIHRLKDRLISATRHQPRDQVRVRLYWDLMVSAINARSAAQIARMERRMGVQ